MKNIFPVIISIFVSVITFKSAYAQGQFGRYTGVFQNDTLQQEQVAKIDFIMSRQDANELKLMAVLSIYFGDFANSEYVSYHFDNVRYNITTGTLVFDQPDQDTTLVVQGFTGGTLTGNLRSAVAGNVGRLVLKQGNNVTISKPLVQPVWGEYRGMCGEYATILQVQTARSIEDTSRVGDPFGTYNITAQLAEADPEGCPETNSACVKNVYQSGTYNFFTGDLNLYGRANDLSCKVGAGGVNCNGCQLKRYSGEAARGNTFSVASSTSTWQTVPAPGRDEPAVVNANDSLQGEYLGYVYHERLGRYQAATFNLIATPDTRNNQLIMSAVATLYFGDHGTQESIAYRFDEKPYNLLSPQVVFERISGDTDAILQVTKIGDGEVQGIWYSLLYGRVGTFLLRKGTPPALPSGALRMEPVAGKYDSPQWHITLRVSRESTPINTRNPFFPLNFKGHARMEDITANIPIAGGSYDFYTGKLTINLNDESSFSGQRPSRSKLFLKRPTPGIIRPIIPHVPQVYQLTSP